MTILRNETNVINQIIRHSSNYLQVIGPEPAKRLHAANAALRAWVKGMGEAWRMQNAALAFEMGTQKQALKAERWIQQDNRSALLTEFQRRTKRDDSYRISTIGLPNVLHDKVSTLNNPMWSWGADMMEGGIKGVAQYAPKIMAARDAFYKELSYITDYTYRFHMRFPDGVDLDGKTAEQAMAAGKYMEEGQLGARAVKSGHADTYTEQLGRIGQTLNEFLNKSAFLRMMAPFITTPTNMGRMAVRHSPFGVLTPWFRNAWKAGDGGDAVARVAIGTSISIGVVNMMMDDEITGGVSREMGWASRDIVPEHGLKIAGEGEDSVWIEYFHNGGHTGYGIGLLAAIVEPLRPAMEATWEALFSAVTEEEIETASNLVRFMSYVIGDIAYNTPEVMRTLQSENAAEPLVTESLPALGSKFLDQSFVSEPVRMVSDVMEGGKEVIPKVAGTIGEVAASVVPLQAARRWVEHMMAGGVRHSDKEYGGMITDGVTRDFYAWFARTWQRIVSDATIGFRARGAVRRDGYGRPIITKQLFDFPAFVNTGRWPADSDPLSKEKQRLEVGFGSVMIPWKFPVKRTPGGPFTKEDARLSTAIVLTPQEQSDMQKEVGELYFKMGTELVESASYKALPDSSRIKQLQDIQGKARVLGLARFQRDNDGAASFNKRYIGAQIRINQSIIEADQRSARTR